MARHFFHIFFSRSFIVSTFIFKPLIHFIQQQSQQNLKENLIKNRFITKNYSICNSFTKAEMYLKFQNVTDTLACKCMAGGTRPGYVHGGGGQPRGSRLVSCTHTATEAWTSFLCGSWREGVSGGEQRGTQAAGFSVNTCGTKAGAICKGSMAALLAISFFFSGESRCRAGHHELQSLPLCVGYW